MRSSLDRELFGVAAAGAALGLAAAYLSLPGNRVEAPEHLVGLAMAAMAGLAAGVSLVGAARGLWGHLLGLAAYAGFVLLAIRTTRSTDAYDAGVVLLLVALGALAVVGYGWLTSTYRRGVRRSFRVAVLVVALTVGVLSVATMVAIAIPVALITLLTWRDAELARGLVSRAGSGTYAEG